MEEIKTKLKVAIQKLYGLDIEPEMTVAPKGVDFASSVAMKLTKELKKNPREIAEEIRREIMQDADFEAEVAGPGFLNFYAKNEYFWQKLENLATDFDKNISCDEYRDQVVLMEFSDPNPFKVLHVGHLYTSVVGEAMSKMVEFAGGTVKRLNFGGDVGLHAAKTMWAMMQHRDEYEKVRQSELDSEKAEFMARCYVEGTGAYEDDANAKTEIVALNKKIYQLVDAKDHEGELAEFYWWGREVSYQYFEDFYKKVGVKFDKYYPESTVAGRGLAAVKEQLKNGVYEMSDGAVVFKGEPYGLHTRVFINNEGLPTYEAKDVGLVHTKWDDYHFDKSFVITGNDIIDYMKVVLTSIKQYNPELVERSRHLTHGNVRLPGNEKMSSRKGNFLRATDVLDIVEEALAKQHSKASSEVALGATKYAFLKYKVGGNIEFNVQDSVSMSGNSGPYLQYAAVRAKKILAAAKADAGAEKFEMSVPEKELVKKIIGYQDVVKTAVMEMAPHKVCEYLYELAQTFSRFYEQVKVVGSEFEFERAKIVNVYYKTLEHGLNLLGIKVPEEM